MKHSLFKHALAAVTGLALSAASLFATAAPAAAKEIKRPDSYAFQRGREALDADNLEEAFKWFNTEIEQNPDNGYAHLYLASIYHYHDQPANALSAANQAIKKIPKKDKEFVSSSHRMRGSIQLALADTVAALADYTEAIKFNPQNARLYYDRADIYFDQERYDLADADYRSMLAIDPTDGMAMMGLGRNAKEQGRDDEAMEYFNKVIQMNPDYDSGYSFRAEVLMRKKKYAEALDDLIKAFGLNYDIKAWYALRTMEKEQLPLMKAKILAQSKREPNEARWPDIMAQAYESNELYREAIPFYEKAYMLEHNPNMLERIADCQYELGNFDDALKTIDRAINIRDDDFDYRYLRAAILEEQRRYPEAIAEVDHIVEETPDASRAYYSRGWLKTKSEDLEGAVEDFSMAVLLNPDDAQSLVSRARAYLSMGKKEEAEADFRRVLEIDTVPGEGYGCAHYAYLFLGEKDKAADFMGRILEKSEHENGNLYDAACLYSLMGETDQAMEYFRQALEGGYRRFGHIDSDHDLDNIRHLPEFKELIEKYRAKTENRDVQEDRSARGVVNQPEDNTARGVVNTVAEVVEVPFTREGGVTKVKCTVNGLPLHFVFDTGASDVTLSMVEANFMFKNDYLKPTDVVGTARYVDANGDISEGTVVNIKNVDFGGLTLENVRASVVRNQKAPLLLGQSVLGRLGKIEIDNPGSRLLITHIR